MIGRESSSRRPIVSRKSHESKERDISRDGRRYPR